MKHANGLHRITFIFFMIMIVFTLFSDNLQQLTKTKVIVTKVKTKTMKVQNVADDGTTMHSTEKYKVIPRNLLDGNKVFILEELDNEYRITSCKVELGKEFDNWVVVTEGLKSSDKIILASDRTPKVGAIAIIMEDRK